MTNENDLTNEIDLEFRGYKDWLNKERIRENERLEIIRLRLDLKLLMQKVSQLEYKLREITNEF